MKDTILKFKYFHIMIAYIVFVLLGGYLIVFLANRLAAGSAGLLYLFMFFGVILLIIVSAPITVIITKSMRYLNKGQEYSHKILTSVRTSAKARSDSKEFERLITAPTFNGHISLVYDLEEIFPVLKKEMKAYKIEGRGYTIDMVDEWKGPEQERCKHEIYGEPIWNPRS